MRNILVPVFYAFVFYFYIMPMRTTMSKTYSISKEWQKIGRPSRNALLEFTILLPQKNIDILEHTLIETSDPNSIHYGKWLSKNAIDSIVYADKNNFTNIYKWLYSVDIRQQECKNTSDSIICKTITDKIDRAFKTRILEYKNRNNNKTIYSGREQGYSIPTELNSAIEFVLGINDLPQLKTKFPNKNKPNDSEGYISPLSIKSLYSIPDNLINTKLSSQSVVEFQGDNCFNRDNLADFLSDNNLKNIQLNKSNIWGMCDLNTTNPDIEATLDIQYQVGTNQKSTQYYVTVSDWLYQYASEMYNSSSPPMVNSMSYGWAEWDQCDPSVFPECFIGGDSEVYAKRTNIEFMKLGLRGVTLLASSGDAGSPGRMSEDCERDKPVNPVFPTSSPWVLSVGGNIVINYTVHNNVSRGLCKKYTCIDKGLEMNCNYDRCGWTAGGGFSNYFNRPPWQVNLVSKYLKSAVSFPPKQFFNKNGRAYPDISLVAHNYLIRASGEYSTVDGTSASSPVMSGLVSILNNLRLSQGKPVLGPIAPLLYDMYEKCNNCFNDLQIGSNNSTEITNCKYGYSATKGYDAVYGLGTPNFNNIYNYVKNMEN